MAIRLRDRQTTPWMQPGGRFITMSSVAMKWTGLLLTCLGSIGTAVIQRGLLKIESYANLDDLSAAMADSSGIANLTSAAVTCALISIMALPLYAKLVYEEWRRMEDRRQLFKYLALCALASEIPYSLAMKGVLLDFEVQNPVWGLLLCAAMLEVLRLKKPNSRILSALLQVLIVAGALAWAVLLRVYLGTSMVLLVALFYFMEGNRALSALGGAFLTMPQFPAPFGALFAYWYEPDEEKDARFPKLFYILYPVQLLVFGAAGLILRGIS